MLTVVEAEAPRAIETSARRIKEAVRFKMSFFMLAANAVDRWADKKTGKTWRGCYRNYEQ